ncbi:MAG: aldehyde ferredoxin oxidoreductase C-terminal domain-containing protein, partial [Promethearchaeota archaeon]
IQAITGWDIFFDELMETGYRIQTLRQMFNAREGAIRHEISQRAIGSPPLIKGPLKDKSYDLEPLAQDYYEAMGFEKNGIPKKETLQFLNLDFAISDLTNVKGISEPLENEYIKAHVKKIFNNPYNIKPLRGG